MLARHDTAVVIPERLVVPAGMRRAASSWFAPSGERERVNLYKTATVVTRLPARWFSSLP